MEVIESVVRHGAAGRKAVFFDLDNTLVTKLLVKSDNSLDEERYQLDASSEVLVKIDSVEANPFLDKRCAFTTQAALDILKTCHENQVLMFIVSTGRNEQYIELLEDKAIIKFTQTEFGKADKAEVIRSLLQNFHILEENAVFVDDTSTVIDQVKAAFTRLAVVEVSRYGLEITEGFVESEWEHKHLIGARNVQAIKRALDISE